MELAQWHSWWKRIGSALPDMADAEDEYDDYGGHVARMLREGTTACEIASYLRRVRIEWMELGDLPGDERGEKDVAERIIEWYENAMRGD